MISPKTLVRLGLSTSTGCPHEWMTRQPRRNSARATESTHHYCVGDTGHRGKHVCRCGASQWVTPPPPPKETHVHASVLLPDGTALATCTCSPDFASTVTRGSVTFGSTV